MSELQYLMLAAGAFVCLLIVLFAILYHVSELRRRWDVSHNLMATMSSDARSNYIGIMREIGRQPEQTVTTGSDYTYDDCRWMLALDREAV